ncbi:MAG: polysaccharide pyruvyl transferase family protein [Chlamydiia bacterium]
MKWFHLLILGGCVGSFSPGRAVEPQVTWGYLSHSTYNVGDDIQALAAKRLLPPNAIGIGRDFIGEHRSDRIIRTIVGGWFMHTPGANWARTDLTPPMRAWPPALHIDPLLISIYLAPAALSDILTEEGIEYLKRHGPVGARDLDTRDRLAKLGIPAYYSGCLTLTLDNDLADARGDVTYLVDVPEEFADYLKSRLSSPIEVVAHGRPVLALMRNDQRLAHAQKLLDRYRTAKLVVTARLHASLPCLAFETPVFGTMANTTGSERFSGLGELFQHGDLGEILSGEVVYNFESPPSNPSGYLELRKQLIETVEAWVAMSPNPQGSN